MMADEDLEAQFFSAVLRWRQQTGGLSSPYQITSNRHYLRIIALGEPMLPLILRDLRDNGGWWFPALRAISGASPEQDCRRGIYANFRQAWLEWGARNGYIEENQIPNTITGEFCPDFPSPCVCPITPPHEHVPCKVVETNETSEE